MCNFFTTAGRNAQIGNENHHHGDECSFVLPQTLFLNISKRCYGEQQQIQKHILSAEKPSSRREEQMSKN